MHSAIRAGRLGPILWLVGAVLAAGPASAQAPKPAPTAASSGAGSVLLAAPVAPGAASFERFGVKFNFDQASGRLQTPTAEQLAALRSALAPLMKQPETPKAAVRHPNGMLSNELGIWNFGASYAFLDPEAGLQMKCVAKLQDLLATPAGPSTEKAEE